MSELANRIKVLRAVHNVTQEELALAVGVTRKTINSVERGRYVPSTVLALKLAAALRTTVEDIFSLVSPVGGGQETTPDQRSQSVGDSGSPRPEA